MFIKLWNYLNSYELTTPDPLTEKLPLVGTPWQVFLINLSYLLFVFKWGPKFMRNRPAYKLKNTLLIYNLFQVLINLGISICAYMMIVHHRVYDLRCMSAMSNDHPFKYFEIWCFYLYYLVKFIDYLDTIFFVLRKSTRQITFLHVYHHLLMATGGYLYMRYIGIGGHISSMGVLNSVVHTFMYFYYLMSALKPSMKNSIWWKKYITRLQLVQFVIIILHNLYPLLFLPNCDSPRFIIYMAIVQASFMLYLFGNFYKKTYLTKSKTGNAETEKTN